MRLFFLLFIVLLHAEEGPLYPFSEIWGYVMKGEEQILSPQKPLTDIAYFSASVSEIGRIPTFPKPDLLKKTAPPKARIHCVISAPYNRSLLYWCLVKDPDTREELLNDIALIALSFDGIQIDFESIRKEDGGAYCSFLQDLRARLPQGTLLSVALPARMREMNDGYPYDRIGEIVDRVLIMAYDEHGRLEGPGPIASSAWCQRVSTFAKEKIPAEKLILGIPLYGRVWQKQQVARALKYFQTLDLWKQVGTLVQRDKGESPYFEFEQKIEAIAYYEDLLSLQKKLSTYRDLGIQAVGFWRLSQEPAALWNHLEIDLQ